MRYNDNKSNGAFILIDATTNTTAGVGFIRITQPPEAELNVGLSFVK
jgi:sulfate adenylyltransferase subunit 1 (EFTu-like GTPase family)